MRSTAGYPRDSVILFAVLAADMRAWQASERQIAGVLNDWWKGPNYLLQDVVIGSGGAKKGTRGKTNNGGLATSAARPLRIMLSHCLREYRRLTLLDLAGADLPPRIGAAGALPQGAALQRASRFYSLLPTDILQALSMTKIHDCHEHMQKNVNGCALDYGGK